MHHLVLTGRRLLVVAAGVVVALSTLCAPAFAQKPPGTVGIRIVDVPTKRVHDPRAREYIVDHVAPGAEITRRVEVNNDTANPKTLRLYVAAGSIANGHFRFGAGRAANELTSWTTVTPTLVRLPSGAKSRATVRISIPRNASPGERYGIVWAELRSAAPSGGGILAVNRVGIRIYLSVGKGGEPASDFSLTAFQASRDDRNRPVVAATVHNSGGRALDISGSLYLTNGPGGLSAGPFVAELGTTLGISQSERVLVILDHAIPSGRWTARMVLHSGVTKREATAQITFPATAGASSRRVVITNPDGPTSLLLPVLLGAALLIFVVATATLISRRRRAGEQRALNRRMIERRRRFAAEGHGARTAR